MFGIFFHLGENNYKDVSLKNALEDFFLFKFHDVGVIMQHFEAERLLFSLICQNIYFYANCLRYLPKESPFF